MAKYALGKNKLSIKKNKVLTTKVTSLREKHDVNYF